MSNGSFGAPLSAAQEQLWFLDRLAPGGVAYNIACAFELSGPMDVDALGDAFVAVQRRHDMLRTVFPTIDGSPAQVILDRVTSLATDDLSALSIHERGAAVHDLIDTLARAPFDLTSGPLLRCALVRLDQQDWMLIIVTHHIASDGRSQDLFLRDLSHCYNARVTGRLAPLPPLPMQFREYAGDQAERLRGGALDRALTEVAERLRTAVPLDLPTDRVRPPRPSFRSDCLILDAPAEVLRAVRTLAAANNASVLIVLMSAFAALLVRYTHQNEIVVGTAWSGRQASRLADAIGPFMNMLVVRADAAGDPTFIELIERVKAELLAVWARRTVPFDRVVAATLGERDPSRNPLFQVAVQLLDHSNGDDTPTFAGVTARRVTVDVASHPFDLSINANLGPDRLRYRVEFATDLFDRDRIERLMGHFEQVLRDAVAEPHRRLSQLRLLTDPERAQLLDWSRGAALPQSADPVHVQIAAVAAAHPDAIAARHDGAELSYAELDWHATALAHRLRALGLEREGIVAVALDKGFDLLVAFVGILKAGGAFATLDPAHPPQRLAYMLADTAAKIVITDSDTVKLLPQSAQWRALLIDTEWPQISAQHAGPLAELADENCLAYVLYTSGSTGKPKGVMIEHHALTTFLMHVNNQFHFGPGDRIAVHMALIFDFSIGEIFSALVGGATVVLVPDHVRLDPTAFADLLDAERINYLGGPPALLSVLPRRPYPHLIYMIAGGEALPADLVNQWNIPPRHFINGYGPTEAAVGCIYHTCPHKIWTAQPPIGRAMPRRTAYILDGDDNLCPIGVPGEIVVGGAGLARGYLNLPEHTVDRFRTDPYDPSLRSYRTGDLGVWRADGTIEFLGRLDTQIKINGLRIELAEIEAALRLHPQVTAAAVVVREDPPGRRHLVGYVASTPDATVEPHDLHVHLAKHLPRFMIPTVFVGLDRFPLTSTGKIDRAALPAPAAPAQIPKPPRTPLEHGVAAAIATALALEHINVDDNFFALGGSSIQAAKVVLDLTQAYGVRLSVADFYATPDVASVAGIVDDLLTDQRTKAAAGAALVEDIAELESQLAHKHAVLRAADPTPLA